MHKKSVEPPSGESGHRSSLTPPPPTTEKPEGRVEPAAERDKETHSKDSREELRENSIAALRAKAQEHSAKMLRTLPEVSGGAGVVGGAGEAGAAGGAGRAGRAGGRDHGSAGVGGARGKEEELN